MLETSLVTRLASITTNIYPKVAPRGFTTPVVIYNRSDTAPTPDLARGTSNAMIWLQVDVYDLTFLGAKTFAETIRKNFEFWSDDEIQAVSWTGEDDGIDNTTETELYRTMLSFQVYVNLD